MQPRLETIKDKKLIGLRLKMSVANNRTGELWRGFGPRKKEIKKTVGPESISLTLYESGYFADFQPAKEFERWAAVEVSDFLDVPPKMETFDLKGGLYAVFDYRGRHDDSSIFQYIYGTWLPGSGYVLDDRPHFEVLGEKYRNDDPESEEEIWIPIKRPNRHK
jgi:AraC family transcriptional regulator